MRAIVLIADERVHPGVGPLMFRLAARIRLQGIAPLAAGCFLHGRPHAAEVLAGCVAQGAAEIVLLPYALAFSPTAHDDLRDLVEAARSAHPHVTFRLAQELGHHPAVAQLLLQRAAEADYGATCPLLGPQPNWPAFHMPRRVGLLIVVSGEADPRLRPREMEGRARAGRRYVAVQLCYAEGGEPDVDTAIDRLVARGIRFLIAAPYTLEPSERLAAAIARSVAAARERHPGAAIVTAEHLAYDRRLLGAVVDRVAEATAG